MSDSKPKLAGIAPIEGFPREGDLLAIMVDPDVTGCVQFQTGDEVRVELPDGDGLVAPVHSVHIEHGLTLWLETERDPDGVTWV